jgi:hypothetical protein
MPPGENPLCPFGAEELLADKIGQDLTAEELRQARVVEPGNLVEAARLVHPALGHQEMEVRMARVVCRGGTNYQEILSD